MLHRSFSYEFVGSMIDKVWGDLMHVVQDRTVKVWAGFVQIQWFWYSESTFVFREVGGIQSRRTSKESDFRYCAIDSLSDPDQDKFIEKWKSGCNKKVHSFVRRRTEEHLDTREYRRIILHAFCSTRQRVLLVWGCISQGQADPETVEQIRKLNRKRILIW